MSDASGKAGEDKGMTRMDRRAAAWPEFLRRMLVGASLAGSAALPATTDEVSPGDLAEAEAPASPGPSRFPKAEWGSAERTSPARREEIA
jgi:hypothetical protein